MLTINHFTNKMYTAKDGFTLPYQIRIPEGEGPFPLLLCLHGAGERGTDNQSQVDYFLPIFNQPNSPALQAISVIPQCPETMRWVEYGWDKGSYISTEAPCSPAFAAVEELAEQLLDALPIDKSRLYVTGLSMGGFATWRMLAEHPDLFAAGLPVCGGGPMDKAKILANIPIRTFHCADDDVVPPKASRDMVSAIRAIEANQTCYTEMPTGGHGAWGPVYDDPTNIEWIFAQKK